MLYTMIACSIVATAANTAEVTTSNLRTGAAIDNLKASWGKALKFGDFNTQLDCTYDRNACKNYLNTATLSGNLVDRTAADDVKLDYEVTKNFQGSKNTEVKLTTMMSGTKVTAEIDSDDSLTKLTAQRVVTVGDREVDMEPSFLVKTQTARLKMASMFGKDKLKAQLDWETEGSASSYELGYERGLADGKVLSATLVPADKNLEIELVDSKFESGATWTATANLPFEDSASVVDNAKLTLKRSWSW